jgi:hypothetical protein
MDYLYFKYPILQILLGKYLLNEDGNLLNAFELYLLSQERFL